jgi:DNA repair exonuclease SbcCD ATPase subunit
VLKTDHILRKAYDKLNAEHKNCDDTFRKLKETHDVCLVTIPSLERKLQAHDNRQAEIESLTQQLKEHDACSATIESLTRQLKEHDACSATIESLTRQLKEHDACPAKIRDVKDERRKFASELDALRKKHEGHDKCAETISDLQSKIQQLESPEEHIETGEVHKGLPEASKSDSPTQTSESALAKVDSDIRYLGGLIAKILEKHIVREDASIKDKYNEVARRLHAWGRADIIQENHDVSRKATFIDFVRDVVVGFDLLVKAHHETFKSVDTATSELQHLHKDMKELRVERDRWKNDCMVVLDRAQLAREAYEAREVGHVQRHAEMEAVIAELQGLLEDFKLLDTA